jgi:uncharacterized membrane protein YphA (DoxX/SURF4 family)
MRYRFWIAFAASLMLGLVFLTSGIGKVLGHGAFLLSLNSNSIVPGPLVSAVGNLLPWIEIVVGLALVAGVLTQIAALIACLMAVAFIFQNAMMISHGLGYQPCSCFGILETVFGGILSTRNALYTDIGMMVLAVAIYFLTQGRLLDFRPRFFKGSWRGDRETPAPDPLQAHEETR